MFEKHSTLNRQIAQRVVKTFVAQFLNTGILILLINAKLDSIGFWQGKFRDITPLWYENVGSTLLWTMVINIFTVPVIKVLYVIYQKIRRWCDRGIFLLNITNKNKKAVLLTKDLLKRKLNQNMKSFTWVLNLF